MSIASQPPGSARVNTSTRSQAMSLGKANLLDFMIQIVLPIVLVRLLDPTEFGQYRMLWLAANAAIALGQLHMPHSLLYLLPREGAERARIYINNTLLFLASTGLIGAVLVGPWNHWLPGQMEHLSSNAFFLPLFIFVWVLASLVEFLPNADQRIAWQARVIVGLSLLRASTIVLVVFVTRDIEWVFAALLLFAFVKLGLLYYYIGKYHGRNVFKVNLNLLRGQIIYAAPFGISGSLYILRGQADQWVVASLFSTSVFATFSVAYVFSPLANIIRQSVSNAVMPRLSELHASGDREELLNLNRKANAGSNFLLFPMLVFFFVFSTQLIELINTGSYLMAADVMRIYLLGMLAQAVEVNSILRVFSQGRFTVRVNFGLLLMSIVVSYLGARVFGLLGAALGSVLALSLGELMNLRHAVSVTNTSFSRFLDWKQLGILLGAAIVAGGVGKGVALLPMFSGHLIGQLFLGGLSMITVYILMLILLGKGDLIKSVLEDVLRRRRRV